MKLKEARNVAEKVLEKTWGKGKGINCCFIMKSNNGDYNIAYSWNEKKYFEELGWKFVEALENWPAEK